jgi:hypothetical protein
MKISRQTKRSIFSVVGSLVVVSLLSACSDDAPAPQLKKSAEHNYFDHAHGSEVSDLKKHKFEHEFAKQCVEREVRNSINKDNDRKRFKKPCLCIATRMMKDLTAVEAEKFLVEQKNTQSLKMSFDEAAFFCVQSKAKPKSPALFGKK